MRLTALTKALVAATLTERANAWTFCEYSLTDYAIGISIVVPNVPDVPGICGGLWDNLKRFPDCIGVSSPECYDQGSGTLTWNFNDGIGCDYGMIESTWWEATKNQYGALDCVEVSWHKMSKMRKMARNDPPTINE